jgi:hypothetical protein
LTEHQEIQNETIVPKEQTLNTNKKMKQCSTCSNIIAKSAKRCPYCGAKNKKRFYKRKRFWIIIFLLIVIIIGVIPKNNEETLEQQSDNTNTTEQTLQYKDVYEGDTIETDFVSITIDEISTTDTIYSTNSSVVYNANEGEQYFYMTGTITNTSNSIYDIGSLGSASYGNTDCMIECYLEMNNDESVYGVLLTDDGSFYGLSSDGMISPQESVKYYFLFTSAENANIDGEITMAFTDGFRIEPSYNRDNCDYLYRINF